MRIAIESIGNTPAVSPDRVGLVAFEGLVRPVVTDVAPAFGADHPSDSSDLVEGR